MQDIVTPLFIVLAFSYLIVFFASRKRAGQAIESYLFSGNTPTFALTSSVGALFSLSIVGTALISAGYVFGWQIIFSAIPGAVVGILFLIFLTKQSIFSRFRQCPTNRPKRLSAGLSYLTAFPRLHTTLSIFYIALYSALLAMELAVVRVTLSSLIDLGHPEIYVILFMIVLVCYSYVFIGGYLGVLVTDYFQLLIIILFVGTIAIRIVPYLDSISSMPGPTEAVISWKLWPEGILLHWAMFIGAFSIGAGSLDQWYRTVGTLPHEHARKVLLSAMVIVSLCSALPIIIGSYQLRLMIRGSYSADISLRVLQSLLETPNATFRFLFAASLCCVILTTLDTYLITIKQLYYEFSIRLHARTHRGYWFEYLLKWRQIRVVGLLILMLSLLTSIGIAERWIYAFGVASLSGFIFVAPVLISSAVQIAAFQRLTYNNKLLVCCLAASAGGSLLVLWYLSYSVGDIRLHLYLIPASIGISTLSAYITIPMFFAAFHRALAKRNRNKDDL